MKKVLKTMIAIALIFIMFQACIPLTAAADTGSATADYSVSNYASLIETIARQYIARDTDFTIKYTASLSEVQNNLGQYGPMWDDVYSVDIPGSTSDLDYLQHNVASTKVAWVYSGTSAVCKFTQTYRTTAAQEQYVNTSVTTILSKLDISDDSAYGKIKAIHDYIVNNVDYDETRSRFTAYDALYSHLTVCQGYTLLTYKMLMEAGIPVRYISGEAISSKGRGAHAWNIVKIGQKWYNLDVTWDDSCSSTKYMLKNNDSFSDHYRDSEYNTSAFNTAYPMSSVNYDLAQDVRLVSSISLTNYAGSLYAVGDAFMLSASVNPIDATNKTLNWSSSNPSVALVDSAGHITVNGAGTAVITASATDGTGKTAKFTVTAIDTPNTWAVIDINALNARGLIPQSLNSAYRNAITRAEFMALIANVYEYAKGPYTTPSGLPFTDISASVYKNDILLGYDLGIIEGMGSNLFGPEKTLTREQCAKIVSNAIEAINGSQFSSNIVLPYTDVSLISDWALPFVRSAFESGLMKGAEGCFNPQAILSREQAMMIIERMIEKYKW